MKELLIKEVESQLVDLSNVPLGTPEYTAAIAGIGALARSVSEIDKYENEKLKLELQESKEEAKYEQEGIERLDRLDLQERQLELQKQQLELQEKQNKQISRNGWIQLGITALVSLIGIGVKVWGTKYTMEYEDTGVMPTTLAGREHSKSLFDNKK